MKSARVCSRRYRCYHIHTLLCLGSGSGSGAGSISALPGLVRLLMSSNELFRIDTGVFGNAVLERVDLADNAISYIAPGSLDSLVSLEYLNLESNRLQAVPSVRVLPKLSTMLLDRNNVTSIMRSDFLNVTRLTTLTLGQNFITMIEPQSFKMLHALSVHIPHRPHRPPPTAHTAHTPTAHRPPPTRRPSSTSTFHRAPPTPSTTHDPPPTAHRPFCPPTPSTAHPAHRPLGPHRLPPTLPTLLPSTAHRPLCPLFTVPCPPRTHRGLSTNEGARGGVIWWLVAVVVGAVGVACVRARVRKGGGANEHPPSTNLVGVGETHVAVVIGCLS